MSRGELYAFQQLQAQMHEEVYAECQYGFIKKPRIIFVANRRGFWEILFGRIIQPHQHYQKRNDIFDT